MNCPGQGDLARERERTRTLRAALTKMEADYHAALNSLNRSHGHRGVPLQLAAPAPADPEVPVLAPPSLSWAMEQMYQRLPLSAALGVLVGIVK